MPRAPATDDSALRRLPCIALSILIFAAVGYILATTAALPDTVATHFDGDGRPNGWMTREGYRIFMLAFTVGLPLVVTAAIGWLPRRFPRALNLPNRDYWLAPERRDAALAYLTRQGCLFGCLMVLFSCGVHALVLDAHAESPPRLDGGLLAWMMAAFLIGLTLWAVALFRRFGRPRAK